MIIFSLNTILPHVVRTAKSAGEFIRKERLKFTPDKIEMKGLNDMVSYVDKGAEKMIVDELNEILPGCGFVVEEDQTKEKLEYNWIVDPLDGTTNFIHGIPCYAVSIALEHKGDILLGVVYDVAKKECFSAYKGGGAFLNEMPIKVSENKKLSDSLIATGFPIYNFDRQENYLNVLKELMQGTHGVRRIGAAAVDLCYVACGRVDAFYEYNLNAWDVAAGALIIKEAGGTLSDFEGEQNWLYGKEIMATNALVEKEFTGLIQKHFK
jgi:myo-inositol-1(or 4)-monophosphatase